MPKNDPESFRGKIKHRALHGGQAVERTIHRLDAPVRRTRQLPNYSAYISLGLSESESIHHETT